MQWCRQRGCFHHRDAPAGLDEIHLIEPADLIGDADVLVELHEVAADAEEDVLAIVDNFSGAGMLVRRGAAAEERSLLEERDPKSGVRQGARGS